MGKLSDEFEAALARALSRRGIGDWMLPDVLDRMIGALLAITPDEYGYLPPGEPDCDVVQAIIRLANHLDITQIFQKFANPLPNNMLILCDHDTNHISTINSLACYRHSSKNVCAFARGRLYLKTPI